MEHGNAAPPFVTELNRFLGLRSRWHEGQSAAARREESLTEADLLVLAFVLSEMDIATLLVDDADLLERLQRTGLAEFVADRSGRPLRVASFLERRTAPLDEGAVLCVDARQSVAAIEADQGMASLRAVVLYGLRETAPLDAIARLETACGAGECVVVSLGGRALALWKATSVLVAPREVARTVEEALERLSTLLNDRSLDPLHLAQSCVDMQVRLRARGDDELARLRARARDLEDEVADLKARLVKQQHSLASYNQMLSPENRANRGALPASAGTTP